ncbi:heat shock factor binding protein 1-domain-containing protein [Aspergillus terreus]|uniref:Heat shock factor binding protein 1-domain-containing protein n=1 Tax=Aspergillus terreus TaxID=33178 RepID=A0A5M3YTK0_ASPTE|nr:hypothetical protein ATETN484_0004015000 [Aspergillus terreus]GFF13040.1 heat shock factor binding protein 1-domain-containing protein [Aspergillus terreus]
MSDEAKSAAEQVSSPAAQPSTDAQEQFTAAVDELLDQLQHKFDTVSREMFGKRSYLRPSEGLGTDWRKRRLTMRLVDDMARRLDELEASLTVVSDAATSNTEK